MTAPSSIRMLSLVLKQRGFLSVCLISAENLKATLSPGAVSPSSLSPRSDTDSVFLSSPAPPVRDVPDHESPPENSAAELPEPPAPEQRSLQQRSQINDMDLKVPLSFCFHTQFQLPRLCEHPSGD